MSDVTQDPVAPTAEDILADLGDPGALSLDETDAPSPDGMQDPAVPDAGPSDASTEPPADTQASDDAPASDEAPAEAATPEPAAPTAEPATPFAFRVDGKSVDVTGAEVRGDTITLSREAWNRQVQPYLADRAGFTRQRQALEQRLQQRGVAEQQAAAFLTDLQQQVGKPDEEVIEWALKLKGDLPVLLAKAEVAALKAQHAPLVAEATQRAEQEQAALSEQQLTDWVSQSLATYLDRPAYGDVKGDARFRRRAEEKLALALPLLLQRQADGQVTADWARFQAILDGEAADSREWQAYQRRVQEIEAAAKANAQKAKAVPPAVRGGAPAGATKTTQPLSRDAFEAELDALASGRTLL